MKLDEITSDNNKTLSKSEIDAYCKILEIRDYRIGGDLIVSVFKDVSIMNSTLKKLPFKFNYAHADFALSQCEVLNTLENCPKIIEGFFAIRDCPMITSLEHCPSHVGSFVLNRCNVETLEHLPKEIDFGINLSSSTKLKSIEGLPPVINGSLFLTGLTISTLKGMPEELNGSLNLSDMKELTSFDYLPKKINGLIRINGSLPKVKNYLKIFKVKGAHSIEVDDKEFQKIFNKHLRTRNIVDCQEELIEAGFKDYARLR